jgi:hypothetical protein
VTPAQPGPLPTPSHGDRVDLARRQHGGALLGLLIGVAAMGAGHLAITEHQATQSQRDREAELLFIGEQFRRAIESYYLASPPAQRLLPTRLEDLLVDTRGVARRTHLRRLYRDPFTGRPDWGLIRAGDRLLGVHSRAQVVPLRRAGFATTQTGFERARTVADWRFVYVPMAAGEVTRVPSPLRSRAVAPAPVTGASRDGGLVQ